MKDQMDEACGTYGVEETCTEDFTGKKSEGQRSLGRIEHR